MVVVEDDDDLPGDEASRDLMWAILAAKAALLALIGDCFGDFSTTVLRGETAYDEETLLVRAGRLNLLFTTLLAFLFLIHSLVMGEELWSFATGSANETRRDFDGGTAELGVLVWVRFRILNGDGDCIETFTPCVSPPSSVIGRSEAEMVGLSVVGGSLILGRGRCGRSSSSGVHGITSSSPASFAFLS